MKHTRLLAATAVAALVSTSAMATPVALDTIRGDWVNVVGGDDGSVIANGDPLSTIRWPDNGGNQSGYDFEAVPTPLVGIIPTDRPWSSGPFLIGTFTHLNQSLTNELGIDSVDLQLSLAGTIDGMPFSLAPFWSFAHNETSNAAPCEQPAGSDAVGSVCDDFVNVSFAAGSTSTSVNVGLDSFTFSVLGFSTDGGANFKNFFQTPEGGNNPAGLYAQVSAAEVAPIPLPAAAWFLLAGLGALGMAARRPRKGA